MNFYKARSVDRIGNVSAWTDYARGMSSTDVNAITDAILDEILDSDAMKELQESAQDSAAKLNEYANSIIQNALANDGDVRIMRKENGKRKAEIKHAEVLIANETEARVQQVNQISAEFNENLNAGLTQVNEAIANETEARVTSEEALSARIGANSAALDQKLDSWANVNSVGSMYTMKLGLKYNGQEYNSGMALQLAAQGDNVVSQVLFIADRFAIIRNAESGAYTLPFVVQNDQVFMNNALIQDGSITNAKIGNVIQSNNYIAGEQGWIINKNGSSEFSGVTVRGHIEADSGSFHGTIDATDGIFRGSVEANSFVGDIAAMGPFPTRVGSTWKSRVVHHDSSEKGGKNYAILGLIRWDAGDKTGSVIVECYVNGVRVSSQTYNGRDAGESTRARLTAVGVATGINTKDTLVEIVVSGTGTSALEAGYCIMSRGSGSWEVVA